MTYPNPVMEPSSSSDRAWVAEAIRKIEADFCRSADTHLIPLPMPGFPGIDVYFKDESSHPTGSLKHRLARSLFLYALANGWLAPETTVVEASSGSTAVSEAYFALLLGLPFVAVMPRATSPDKIAAIEFYGGRCHLVDDSAGMHETSARLAVELRGHFMDQFTYAERATDWRANNNIAESIFSQMKHERFPTPSWIVCGAGTGGTSATIGRFVRYAKHATRVMCADPEHSVFFEYYRSALSGPADRSITHRRASRIEGIGRSRVEASFLASCVDAMIKVPDELSLAGMRLVTQRLGKRVGGSTGTNFVGALELAQRMRDDQASGSIVSILCDSGDRYGHSYYNPAWYVENGVAVVAADLALAARRLPSLPFVQK